MHSDNDEFKDFDVVDEAHTEPVFEVGRMLEKSELSDASKDLLRRLLESNPQHRLKSLLALQRIAFFHNYSFDDVRQMKVSRGAERVSFSSAIVRELCLIEWFGSIGWGRSVDS